MIDYIKKQHGNRPGFNEGERQELKFLQNEVKKLKGKVRISMIKNGSTASDGSSGSDSECEEVADLPTTNKSARPTGPRMSVSAEVFGKFNIEKEYIPPVHPKDAEQI